MESGIIKGPFLRNIGFLQERSFYSIYLLLLALGCRTEEEFVHLLLIDI